MKNDSSYKRWYDQDPKMTQALNLIKSLPEADQEKIAMGIMDFVKILRKNKSTITSEEDKDISIGKERVLGLYKASNKNRWYDKNPALMSAMKMLSTLPPNDLRKVAEGIIKTIDIQ